MSRSSSAYSVKVAQVCFALGFLGLVLFGLRSMMFGSKTNMTVVLGLVLVSFLVLVLDNRYWAFPCFCFGFYDQMPLVKFTGAELGSLVLLSTFFLRQALHRDKQGVYSKSLVWAAVPFLAWMCLVWFMNPTGMFIFGSSAIGGRFYFKVVLAFLSLFCLSSMRFSENDCKLLGCSLAAGYLAHTVFALFFGNVEESVLGSRTHYTFIPMSFVAPLFLCRFSVPELLTRFWPFFGFLVSFGLAVYSGNRTGASRPVLVGLMAPFFLKRDRMKSVAIMICSAIFLGVVASGQGRAWNLPFSIQRTLSFLPGKWDRRLDSYGFGDTFRATLRMYAREHIQANPWFGDGGFSLNLDSVAWTNARNDYGDMFSGHIVARNWHNVWLGMAADFGIPLSIAWGLFMTVLIIQGYWGTKRLPPGSWWQTMYLYCYLLILTEFVNFFFNGGHTALTTQQLFLWAGLMTAVLNGVPRTDNRLLVKPS